VLAVERAAADERRGGLVLDLRAVPSHPTQLCVH